MCQPKPFLVFSCLFTLSGHGCTTRDKCTCCIPNIQTNQHFQPPECQLEQQQSIENASKVLCISNTHCRHCACCTLLAIPPHGMVDLLSILHSRHCCFVVRVSLRAERLLLSYVVRWGGGSTLCLSRLHVAVLGLSMIPIVLARLCYSLHLVELSICSLIPRSPRSPKDHGNAARHSAQLSLSPYAVWCFLFLPCTSVFIYFGLNIYEAVATACVPYVLQMKSRLHQSPHQMSQK